MRVGVLVKSLRHKFFILKREGFLFVLNLAELLETKTTSGRYPNFFPSHI